MNSSITAFFGSVAAGTGIGLAQWIVLRRRVQKAGWWILATTVGLVVPIVFSSTFYSSLWPIGLVGWLAQGAITGAVLVWLLNLNRPKQGAEETPVARARLPWWGWVAIVIAVIACLICGLGTLSYLPTLLRQFGFQ